MYNVNPNRVKFYEFLNGDIDRKELEKWVYQSKELQKEIPEDHYMDLISFSFKTGDLKSYVSKLVEVFFDWQEFEKWRTIKLLTKIINGEIEVVAATRELRKLYLEQQERIKWPLISIELGIGFESVLEDFPHASEYDNWNNEALKKRLESFESYKEKVLKTAKHELIEITNSTVQSIDMGQIVSLSHMHQIFCDKLRFPAFYGENWDALWDTLTGLIEMPKKLVLYNWAIFEKEHPENAIKLRTLVADYNNEDFGKEIEIMTGDYSYDDMFDFDSSIR